MNKNKKIIVSAVVVIIVGAVAFYAGILFNGIGKKSNQFLGQNLGVSIRGNRQGGAGFNSGEIISKDDKSITIKLTTGGSKIIFFSDKTEVGKFVNGTINDLEVGKTVMVQGQSNQDGSITAQSIQLRPINQNLPGQQTPGQ